MKRVSRTATLSLRLSALLVTAGAATVASGQASESYLQPAPAAPQKVTPPALPAPTPLDYSRPASAGGHAVRPPAAPRTPPILPPSGRATDLPPGTHGGGGGGGGVQDTGITLIDFESLHYNGNGVQHVGNSYVEDGFFVTKDGGEPFEFATMGEADSRYPGSTAMFNDTIGGITYFYALDYSPFSLEFMEFANLNSNGPTTIVVHGVRYDGSVVDRVCTTFETFNQEDTFYFSGFNDLYYVYWTQDAPYHQFDNIGVVRTPVVIDFQGLEIADGNSHEWGPQYYENGFLIDQDPGQPYPLSTFGTLASKYPGSTALFDNTVNGRVTLTQYGGGTFNVHSIDLSNLNNNGPVSVTFTGTRYGGSTLSKTFKTVGAPNGLQTFHFNGFINLASLSWTQDSPFHQFDNIVLSRGQQTLDFIKLYHNDDQTADHGIQYRQDGFRITKGPNEPFNFASFGAQDSRYPGSVSLFNNTVDGLMHVETIDGTPFSLRGIELSPLNSGGTPVTVHFVGHRGDGAVLNQFNTTSGGDLRLETFSFDGEWRNLNDVEWTQDSPFHQFDNVRLVRSVALLDFQDLEHVDANVTYVGEHYFSSGFHVRDMSGAGFLGTFGTLESRYPGSTAMFNDWIGATTRLSANDGGDFDLLQMDIAQLNNVGNGPVNVTFVGTKTDGSQVFQSFTAYDPSIFLQTCRFVGFDTLRYVEWTQDYPYHQFDNIVAAESAAEPCYADCDGDGELTFFDFLCYTNAFNANQNYADCDGNGILDFFDFLCYTNAFNAGC